MAKFTDIPLTDLILFGLGSLVVIYAFLRLSYWVIIELDEDK